MQIPHISVLLCLMFWATLAKKPQNLQKSTRSSQEKVEYIYNRPTTKYYKSEDVNATAVELLQNKNKVDSFLNYHKLSYETKVTGVNKI